MRHITWRSAIPAALLVATGALAQDKRSDEALMIKILAPDLLSKILAMARPAATCYVDPISPPPKLPDHYEPCRIEIKRIRYPDADGGTYYCVAEAPEVKVQTDPAPDIRTKRRIRWWLTLDELHNRPLAFHPDYGIVLTKDQHRQFDRRGDIGNGVSGNFDKNHFHTWTRRSLPGAEATYLPVILWGLSGEEELCAAVDPKIANI